jgi:hypothetical protein
MKKRDVVLSIIVVAIMALFFSFMKPTEETDQKIIYPSKDDLITVQSLTNNEGIISPLTIHGKARGNWYFEGTFPVVLTDWDGKIIAETYATAQGEWMTEEYVPFIATIEFKKPEYVGSGYLIFKKDNPSGLRENDNALEIPIVFK